MSMVPAGECGAEPRHGSSILAQYRIHNRWFDDSERLNYHGTLATRASPHTAQHSHTYGHHNSNSYSVPSSSSPASTMSSRACVTSVGAAAAARGSIGPTMPRCGQGIGTALALPLGCSCGLEARQPAYSNVSSAPAARTHTDCVVRQAHRAAHQAKQRPRSATIAPEVVVNAKPEPNG